MGKMTVYHGSYTTVEHPDIRKSRNTKDFGPGFYCTIIREQAERWARRYDTPVTNTYTVRMDTTLNILEFKEMTKSTTLLTALSRGNNSGLWRNLNIQLTRSTSVLPLP